MKTCKRFSENYFTLTGNLVLEIFIKSDAPKRPVMPNPEHTGLRHLAFRVENVERCLSEFDAQGIRHENVRTDDFDGKKWHFSLIQMASHWKSMNNFVIT